MPVLKNVAVMWAHVQQPSTQFDPAWEIQAVLTPEQAKWLSDEAKKVNSKGVKIKKGDDGQLSFRFRRKVEKAGGNGTNPAPVVFHIDTGKIPFTENIGNGSICNIQFSFIGYENKFGKGVTNDLKGVQVVTHVPYGVSDGDEFDLDPDNSSSTTSKSSNSFDEFDEDL